MPVSDTILLRELLAAETGHVSGAKLARMLGVSRVAVWAHLKKLELLGFEFEGVRSRGYRIVRRPENLHAPLIQAHLRSRTRQPALVCLETVDSTNSEAERRLAAGSPVPLVILAQAQTQGRGRRGRSWHSPAQGNLYLSFVFRPRLEPSRMQDFTLWMGLTVCELVANFCKLSPGLKWPNDLFVNGRKAGGMLTEARIDADEIRDLVFGLGLNVNGRADALPRDLQRTATTLADATGQPLDLNRFAAALIGRIMTGYHAYLDGSYRETFTELWQRYDVLRGQRVSVVHGHRTVTGIADGIDSEGALVVRLGHGTAERFRAGEVTLGKDPSAP